MYWKQISNFLKILVLTIGTVQVLPPWQTCSDCQYPWHVKMDIIYI